jgi:hypothetical protein
VSTSFDPGKESNMATAEAAVDPELSDFHSRMRMLEQMAEALEDEASGLYHRATACEEEEFLLVRGIEERQTEINRLQLKLDALRADRDGILDLVNTLRAEASALREELYSGQEMAALAILKEVGPDSSHESMFFRRRLPSTAAGSIGG